MRISLRSKEANGRKSKKFDKDYLNIYHSGMCLRIRQLKQLHFSYPLVYFFAFCFCVIR